ncbi:hypothetical protein I2486_16405 [Cellulophaga sp. E16_2]|uniref:hypothetical protein n=1 Tax=Cellulophaga sp. E16_2 TaxID=2789297 RepID=UPI001A91A501|nr:hypothetical protein [Cellulophaga sp. E16_2]MBO0592986.1 hypothetical protein [Cellulophaga sp. E16_2]
MESILFIFLIGFGGLFLTISLVILLIGLIKKSSKLKKIALGIGIIPILCFGLIGFWYAIAVPSFNNSQMEDFAGIYILHKSGTELLTKNGIDRNQIELTLNSDGTYRFDGIEAIGLDKNGTWKTGGIDGMFEFDVQHGIEFANPSGSGDESALSFKYQMDKGDWENTKSILFVKR